MPMINDVDEALLATAPDRNYYLVVKSRRPPVPSTHSNNKGAPFLPRARKWSHGIFARSSY